MKTSLFFLALLAGSLFATPYANAASQRECLKAIELTKRFELDNRNAHAVYQQEKTEIARCEFLDKSKRHLAQAEKAADICQAYEPELAKKLKADAVSGLQMLGSSKNTCNSKTKADLLAEKRCLDAQKSTKTKHEIFQRALATYNSNKNNQTLCSLLKVSLEYFNDTERTQKLCEAILETGEPSKAPEIREWIQQTGARRRDLCK